METMIVVLIVIACFFLTWLLNKAISSKSMEEGLKKDMEELEKTLDKMIASKNLSND